MVLALPFHHESNWVFDCSKAAWHVHQGLHKVDNLTPGTFGVSVWLGASSRITCR